VKASGLVRTLQKRRQRACAQKEGTVMTTKWILPVLLTLGLGLGSAAVGYARPSASPEQSVSKKAPRRTVKTYRNPRGCPEADDPTGGCERPSTPVCFWADEWTCVCDCGRG
jgi:hypothetical protein